MLKAEKKDNWFANGIDSGWIGVYEREMIRFMEQEFGLLSEEEKLCVIFTSLFVKDGHVCLPLDKTPADWAKILDLDISNRQLPDGKIVPEKSTIIGPVEDEKPLVLDNQMLFIRRYWNYEHKLLQWITEKSSNNKTPLITSLFTEQLKILFYESRENPDWQKIAAAMSLIKPFLIISGGPGTGKTTTVAKILLLRKRLEAAPLNIALAAPTGKAAGRMGEALHRQLGEMNVSESEAETFPREAQTIHRLLAKVEDHGLLPPVREKKLQHDIIIVDEASMIDLTLIYRLISKMRADAQLILLGDKDQLASVEAGSVFADLCQKSENKFLSDTVRQLQQMGITDDLPVSEQSAMEDSIVYLTKSYRFDEKSGIGRLAKAVKQGMADKKELQDLTSSHPDLDHFEFDYRQENFQNMMDDLLERIRKAQSISDPQTMMEFWKQTIWLGVLRRGLSGTDRLNRFTEENLALKRITEMDQGWYHGRPVIITRNDYNLGVFNGDLGVCLQDEKKGRQVYVESGGGIHRINPRRLTHFSPAYFLTVHKSQGSEFRQVNLLLPRDDTPILTKELIYTAITRSIDHFTLFGDPELFILGTNRRMERYTGLNNTVTP